MKLAPPPLIALFGLLCHLEGTNAAHSISYHGQASFYGLEACRVNPNPRCPTASGASLPALIAANTPYMAAWFGDFGSWWRVCGPEGCAVAILLDRGPAKRLNRIADLSPTVFAKVCGSLRQGVCLVTINPLP